VTCKPLPRLGPASERAFPESTAGRAQKGRRGRKRKGGGEWRTREKSWESGVATSRVRHGISLAFGACTHVVIVTLADVARPRSQIWGSTSPGAGYPQSAAAAVAHWLESLEPTGLGQRDELGGSRLGKRGIVRSAPVGRSKQGEEGRLVPVPLTGTGPVSRHCPTLPADCTFSIVIATTSTFDLRRRIGSCSFPHSSICFPCELRTRVLCRKSCPPVPEKSPPPLPFLPGPFPRNPRSPFQHHTSRDKSRQLIINHPSPNYFGWPIAIVSPRCRLERHTSRHCDIGPQDRYCIGIPGGRATFTFQRKGETDTWLARLGLRPRSTGRLAHIHYRPSRWE